MGWGGGNYVATPKKKINTDVKTDPTLAIRLNVISLLVP
jgi:hypothetical protein